MAFMSGPYAEDHLADVKGLSAISQRFLAEAAQRGYTGELVLPDGTKVKMQHGDTLEAKPPHGGWKKFAITAAVLVGGGVAAASLPAGAAATSAGTTAGTTAATTAATAGPGLFSRLAGPIISGVATLGSTAIQAHANSEAVKAEQDAAAKALALQDKMFEQHRADEAPYRQIGTGALGLLGQGMGIDMTPPPTPEAQSSSAFNTAKTTAQQTGTLASMGPPPAPPQTSMPTNPALGTEPMVRVYSPGGQVGQVPQSKLQAALAAGGRMA